MKRFLYYLLGILVALALGLQLVPVSRTNPPVTREVKFDSPETRALAKRACFDCHSNETVWPWYSRIAPISLMLADHVIEGRAEMNFSEWDKTRGEVDDIGEVIAKGEMPLKSYLLAHPEAKLTEAEKDQLMYGLELTVQQDPPPFGERDD